MKSDKELLIIFENKGKSNKDHYKFRRLSTKEKVRLFYLLANQKLREEVLKK